MFFKLQTHAYSHAEVHHFNGGFDTMYLMYEDKSLEEGINQAEKLVEKECRCTMSALGSFTSTRKASARYQWGSLG